MAVSTPAPTTVARTTPARTTAPIPLAPRQARRLRLLDALTETGCELIALGAGAIRALADSREPDAEHDRHLIAARRLAIKGAEESAALHGCGCSGLFLRINAHALEAQRHDLAEDGLIWRAFGTVARICQIARGMNVSLTRELRRRATRGGRP